METVEVEVVGIDNLAPVTRRTHESTPEAEPWHRGWQGRVMRIPGGKWWPLWVMPAVLVAVVVLAIGLAVGLLVAICWIILRAVRVVFGSGSR